MGVPFSIREIKKEISKNTRNGSTNRVKKKTCEDNNITNLEDKAIILEKCIYKCIAKYELYGSSILSAYIYKLILGDECEILKSYLNNHDEKISSIHLVSKVGKLTFSPFYKYLKTHIPQKRDVSFVNAYEIQSHPDLVSVFMKLRNGDTKYYSDILTDDLKEIVNEIIEDYNKIIS
jgi:hypothetical protein